MERVEILHGRFYNILELKDTKVMIVNFNILFFDNRCISFHNNEMCEMLKQDEFIYTYDFLEIIKEDGVLTIYDNISEVTFDVEDSEAITKFLIDNIRGHYKKEDVAKAILRHERLKKLKRIKNVI